MRDENRQLMDAKRGAKDLERQQELAKAGTTPAAIGDGYGTQLARMEENERQKSLMMQRYADSVGSPAR